jgi:hypothetical protein
MRNKKRRNRRKRVNGYAHRVPMAVFVVLAMMLLIGMLWVKADCDAIGTEIRKLEEVSQELSERLLTEEMKWNRLRSVDRIRRSLATNGIQMDWPGRNQVVVLQDSRPWSLAENTSGQDTSSHRYADAGRMGGYE